MEYLVSVAHDFVESLITLLVILNPIKATPFFCSLTAKATLDQRKSIAKRTALVTSIILLVFAYFGDLILAALHITLDSVMIAQGIFLVAVAITDVTSHEYGALPKKTGSLSREEANHIAVFPLATPLLAGPAAIATVIVLNNPSYGVAKGLTDISTPLAILISSIIVPQQIEEQRRAEKREHQVDDGVHQVAPGHGQGGAHQDDCCQDIEDNGV